MEDGRTLIVDLEGHNYFVVDQDLSKGDRRCDGVALATFFNVEAGSTTCNNVRESSRLKKRREAPPTGHNQYLDNGTTVEIQRNKKGARRKQQPKGAGDPSPLRIVALRSPTAGIRCAGRNDTTRLLWLNEFYFVHEGTKSKGKNYIYSAIQFALGEHVPVDEAPNMTDRMRRSIWVQGRCHLPAEHVRRF
jgi:hypothetical protein